MSIEPGSVSHSKPRLIRTLSAAEIDAVVGGMSVQQAHQKALEYLLPFYDGNEAEANQHIWVYYPYGGASPGNENLYDWRAEGVSATIYYIGGPS